MSIWEEIGTGQRQTIAFSDDPLQNVSEKVKKSSAKLDKNKQL